MTDSAETASLFTRGRDSVRLVRRGRPEGPIRLFVLGPGSSSSVHDCLDAIDCVTYQSRIEGALVGEGYQLASFSAADRRSGGERRRNGRGHDRRREFSVVTG
jgi:hypothetical protein